MTKEPIMIDDVDVSECDFYIDSKNLEFNCKQTPQSYFCKNQPNCYYKQLKRKEQECEELNNIITSLENTKEELLTKIDQRKEEHIIFTLETRKLVAYYSSKLEQLKQALQEIKDYCNKYPQNSIGFKKQILQKCEVIKDANIQS